MNLPSNSQDDLQDDEDAVQPVRVCHLITDLHLGGAERALARMLKYTDRRRYEPTVACLFGGDGEPADEIRGLGVPVLDLGMKRKWRLDALFRLRGWLRREDPLILHAWMFHANMAARIVGKMTGVPHIVTSRRNEDIGGWMRERLNRWTRSRCDWRIVVGERVRSIELKRAGGDPTRVTSIPNGVDVDAFPKRETANWFRWRKEIRDELGLDDDCIVLGCVARLRPQKGIEDLVLALGKLREAPGPTPHLLLVGDGAGRPQLEQLLEAEGLDEFVHLVGHIPNPNRHLAAMDVFVLSSHWEGMPNAVLEAMAAELPVVATDVGAVKELVRDGETGLLTSPRQPDELASMLTLLLQSRSRMRELGKAGRLRAETFFSMERVAAATQSIYRELLRGRS